jgi:hypothetical protein
MDSKTVNNGTSNDLAKLAAVTKLEYYQEVFFFWF